MRPFRCSETRIRCRCWSYVTPFEYRMPEAKVHLYGKGERPDRKIGHVNIVGREGDSPESVRERAERAAQWMSQATWTDGWDEHS